MKQFELKAGFQQPHTSSPLDPPLLSTVFFVLRLFVCDIVFCIISDKATLRRCGQLIGIQCPIHSWCIPDNCRVQNSIDVDDYENGKKLKRPGCDSSSCGKLADHVYNIHMFIYSNV